jgi:molybdopterin-guanine dinucleotide biosynthesis protein A
MTKAAPLAGLVLCGGRGSRMGADKATIPFGGEPMFLRVARRVDAVARPVILAPGTPGRLGDLGYLEVGDAVPSAGPMAGLVAGLSVSPHQLTAVVAADMPYASGGVLRLLADLHVDEDVVLPVTSTGVQPLHAVYSSSALPALRSALSEGRLGLRRALSHLRVREVLEPDWGQSDPAGRFASNVNLPEDVERVAAGDVPSPGGLRPGSTPIYSQCHRTSGRRTAP